VKVEGVGKGGGGGGGGGGGRAINGYEPKLKLLNAVVINV